MAFAYLTALSHYLGTKPDGAVLVCLIVALVLFIVMAVVALFEPVTRFYPVLLAAGLAFLVLAFLL